MSLHLNRLTLAFKGEQEYLEKPFLGDYFFQSLPQLRKAIISLTILYLAFTISDAILDPAHFTLFASVRWFITAPSGVLLYWSTYRKWFQQLFQPLTAIALLVGASTTIFFITTGNKAIQISYHYSIYLVLISIFALFRIRFVWAASIGLLTFLSYQIALHFGTNLSQSPLTLIFVFQGSFVLLGSFVSYQLEYLTRREFLAKSNLNLEREKLEKEVLERTSDIEQNYLNIRLETKEKAKLTEKLHQIQQLESIALLAGGIAHDFNNILTGILGNVALATHQKLLPPFAETHFNEILQNANRATELTKQLLEFSNQQPIESILLDPNEIIEGLVALLKGVVSDTVIFQVHLESNIGNILVNRAQFERVITNLVVNANDAMPTGGSLTISTFSRNSSVVITVSDTGEGIPIEIQSKILNPFFTTKDIGKGTGLGLATSSKIIKQLNGRISVKSKLQEGSTFEIELPEYTEKIPIAESKLTTNYVSGNGQTILMVEDDPAVLQIGTEFLQMLGYFVISADMPKKAIEMFDNVEIDLLFTDIIMPQMTGARLGEILREKQPDLPILFTSGYTSDVLQKHNLEELHVSLLQKPYTLQTLSDSISAFFLPLA